MKQKTRFSALVAGVVVMSLLLGASAAQAQADLTYIPVAPCSIVDTRNTVAGRIAASEERDFHVFGDAATISAQGGNAAGCLSPEGIVEEPLAVHINVIAVGPTGQGNMKAFPLGSGPEGLSVNYNNTLDTNLANAGTVGTATSSGPDITVASNFADAHAVISVLGYYYPTEALLYTPVAPCSIVDTRNTDAGRIAASEERDFHVFGTPDKISAQGGNADGCPSPGGEPVAAHINMIAVGPTGQGNMKAFPLGSGPDGLSVNYNNTLDTNLANAGTVGTKTGSQGPDITVASNFADAHAVISVLGYYYTLGDLAYTPVTPCSIVDTRNTDAGRIVASEERHFHVFGDAATISAQGGNAAGCPSPEGVVEEPLAVHINMIAVGPTAQGNLKAFPLGSGPEGLSVNYNTIGTNLANAGTVGTGTSAGPDKITVTSNFADAHAVISVLGYYYPGAEPPEAPPDDGIAEWCLRDACELDTVKYDKCTTFLPICLAGASNDSEVEKCLATGSLICWEFEPEP